MIVDRGVDRGEFLQGHNFPELRHRPLSSSKRLVRDFGPIVEPTPTFLAFQIADHLHCHAVRPEPVRHDGPWPAVAFHCSFEKLQRCPAIPVFCGKDLKHLTLVINSPPQILGRSVDPDKHLIQVPSPLRIGPMMNAPLPDLRSELRTESVPPETHGFVADIDAPLEQQIFDLSQRQRIPDVHHHREANDLGRTVEITERNLHRCKLWNSHARLKPVRSDNALGGNQSNQVNIRSYREDDVLGYRWPEEAPAEEA